MFAPPPRQRRPQVSHLRENWPLLQEQSRREELHYKQAMQRRQQQEQQQQPHTQEQRTPKNTLLSPSLPWDVTCPPQLPAADVATASAAAISLSTSGATAQHVGIKHPRERHRHSSRAADTPSCHDAGFESAQGFRPWALRSAAAAADEEDLGACPSGSADPKWANKSRLSHQNMFDNSSSSSDEEDWLSLQPHPHLAAVVSTVSAAREVAKPANQTSFSTVLPKSTCSQHVELVFQSPISAVYWQPILNSPDSGQGMTADT